MLWLVPGNAIVGILIPGLRQGQVQDLLVPAEPLLDVHEPEHQGLVPGMHS